MHLLTSSIKSNLYGCTKVLNSPRDFLRIGLRLAILLIILNIFFLAIATTAWQRSVINEVAAPVSTLLASVGLAYGAHWSIRLSARIRSAWNFMTGAAACSFVGDCIFFIQVVILKRPISPSISDLFYLAAYPLFLAGAILLLMDSISLRDLGKFGLDIAIIVLSSILISWILIIGPIISAGATRFTALAVAIAYPVGDLILIWAVVLLILRPYSTQPRQPLWLFFAAAMLIIIGDISNVGPQAVNSSLSSDWISIIFLAVPLILMLSGMLQAVQATTPAQSRDDSLPFWFTRIMHAIRLVMPYFWLGGAYLVMVLEPISQPMFSRTLVSVWVAVIVGFVIVRQIIALNENQCLTDAMHHLNIELEDRVLERTNALTQANNELRLEIYEREHIERVLREREEKLAYNALHDALTGLPNRTLLSDRLIQVFHRQQRQKDYNYALLFLDFDGFKVVNDSLGHLSGDQLLVNIAQRLQSSVRDVDTVARLGGDEFVILVENVIGDEGARQAAERLQEKLSEPCEIGGQRIFLSASIGVVPGNKSYNQPVEILQDADLAMYEAKAQGKARSVLFTPKMRAKALDRLVMENDLRNAIERGEFVLHYQPILELDINKITGFEALIRWHHPVRGLIQPGDFIPTAETAGLIVPITEWALGEACRQMKKWQLEIPNGSDLSISVNLSPKLFSQPELPKMVVDALAKSGLKPHSLNLEITEGAIVEDADEAKKILTNWREQSIQIHMDDFGTGYSSLSYLHHFPIDTLKIDRAFISRIQANGDQGEIVRTIIALARELNISVVAEGVETVEQLDFLKRLGCQYCQGFYISNPLEPIAAGAFLIH
jgi:diguanylate cyclase (GGDEF)-like protein